MPDAKLEYTWRKDKAEKDEADPGIKFGVEDAGGEKVVCVVHVAKAREIVSVGAAGERGGVHLIVPGCVVERVQVG